MAGTVEYNKQARGTLAQLGERLVRNEEVGGSIPLCSTIFYFLLSQSKVTYPKLDKTTYP